MKLTDAQYEVLQQLYQVCYDDEGHVKVCGRDNCICLIQFLNDLTHTENLYGDVSTGFLNNMAVLSFVKSVEVF